MDDNEKMNLLEVKKLADTTIELVNDLLGDDNEEDDEDEMVIRKRGFNYLLGQIEFNRRWKKAVKRVALMEDEEEDHDDE